MAGFQKTDFGVSRACGSGNTKIGFITRIAVINHNSWHSMLNQEIFGLLGQKIVVHSKESFAQDIKPEDEWRRFALSLAS
jgi:hypothetical protein